MTRGFRYSEKERDFRVELLKRVKIIQGKQEPYRIQGGTWMGVYDAIITTEPELKVREARVG